MLVLDGAQVIDGTGAPPIPTARIVVSDGRITAIGPLASTPAPDGAEHVDLSGRTIVPGLIDLHFHIENDPKLALRQLSHGVTAFRDPGQWDDKFVPLREMVAADGLKGPHIFTCGPHIDGDHPAYPNDAVVARDADEARRLAERNVEWGATALKIYFRLPLASAKAVIEVCNAHHIPCTAHLEILDAREALLAGLHGIEHVTSLGPSLLPPREREKYRQAVLLDNDARRDGRYESFAHINLDGPDAQALYAVLRDRRPFLDPTLAVFERRADAPPAKTPREKAEMMAAGFEKMKQLDAPRRRGGRADCRGRALGGAVCRARRSALARDRAAGGERLYAARGDSRGHRHRGGVPLSERRARHVASGPDSRSGGPRRGSAEGHPRRPQRRAGADGGRLGQRGTVQGLLAWRIVTYTRRPG